MRTILLLTIFLGQPGGAVESPERTVDVLVSAQHGLTWASGPEVSERLAAVKRDPARYVALLSARLEPNKIANDDSGEAARRAENAAAVLIEAGGESGRAALVIALRALENARGGFDRKLKARAPVLKKSTHPELVALQRQGDRLARVEGAVVLGFTEAKDARLRDLLLERIQADAARFAAVYLGYFERVTPKDPVVKERLRPLLDAPDSPLFHAPRLRAFLEAP